MAENFYQLKIWKSGYDLLMEIYKITAKYPREEKFDLTSQTRRSANSIIGNIAESCGCYYYKDKVRVLYQARGEVGEIRSHLKVAEGLGFINSKVFSRLEKGYQGLFIGISNYIKSFRKQINLIN
jgi:four helix bundle protein